ncbi:MAG: hypothetical protein RIC35_17250 [Marinoscillum sp.]
MLETRQTNRFQMMLAVQSFMDSNQSTWTAIPIIENFKTSLDDQVLGIKEQLQASGTDTRGMTANKNQLKEQIADKTAALSGALAAFAAVTGANDVKANGYLTKTQVASMRDVNLPEEITRFISMVKESLAELADYGISEAQVTDLESSVDDFRELIGQPRMIRSQASTAKREANTLINDAITLLNDKLDKILLQFKFTNPTFYDGYERARVIVD